MRWRLHWPSIQPPAEDAPLPPLSKRLAWMAGIWAGSVLVLLVIAWLLRLVLL